MNSPTALDPLLVLDRAAAQLPPELQITWMRFRACVRYSWGCPDDAIGARVRWASVWAGHLRAVAFWRGEEMHIVGSPHEVANAIADFFHKRVPAACTGAGP